MSRETELIQNIRNAVFESCQESRNKIKPGTILVIDDAFKMDHGDYHKYIAGDEFRVVSRQINGLLLTVTKANPNEGGFPRAKVGDTVLYDSVMLAYDYLRIKGDKTLPNKIAQLCSDYLKGV